MGKGSRRRRCLVPRRIEELRWALATGKITFKQYERKIKEIKKIKKLETTKL